MSGDHDTTIAAEPFKVTRENVIETIERVAADIAASPNLNVVIPPDLERQLFLRQMLGNRSGKSIAVREAVRAEIERRRALNGTAPVVYVNPEHGEFENRGFGFVQYVERVNYQAVLAGTLLNPRFGPPLPMPIEPNRTRMATAIRIVLARSGAELAFF